jgi:excinuclease UvrABC ATPase subunit
MNKSHIIAVAGAAGVGKTTWISQQLATAGVAPLYFCPKTDDTPIDSTHLVADFPQLVVLANKQVSQLQRLSMNTTTYIEMGFHLSLSRSQ